MKALKTLSPLEAASVGLLPGTKVYDIHNIASLLGCKVSTARQRRSKEPERMPPGWVLLGGQLYWPVDALVGWRPPQRPSRRGRWDRSAKRVGDRVADAAKAAIAAAQATAGAAAGAAAGTNSQK